MKKIFFSFVILSIIFSFFATLDAKQEKKLIKRPAELEGISKLSREDMQAKKERLFQAKERKLQLIEKHGFGMKRLPADNPNAVDMQLDSSYTYWQNGLGDVYMTGLCYNAGTSYAAMVEAEVTFYDINQNYLGDDYGYVYGGTYNVQYGTSGYCTNELAPGEYGFFWVWPNVAYADAYYYSTRFTYEDSTTFPYANATLDFDPAVYYTNTSGYLNFYGDVRNYSSNYVTYYTEVHFAAFNTDDTKVVDVDYTFVDGSSYQSSSSAIFPGTTEPFDLLFFFAEYSNCSGSYLPAFEWYEAMNTTLEEKDPPFGSFATPIDNSTVSSSVPVTGWALDDSGVDHVKIYRGPSNNLVYIGDAQFVEGARPDIAAAYPQYPNNTRAGWGYMMLTNFLPNGGNGTFNITAIATDIYGKPTTLGTKTITCDNAHAVKPFGAIDTPTQGGTASGSSFVNWGWVLTPQPNSISTDGSSINVFVDGVNIGHPNYNIYRSDIASLFPGYANSNGAAGYFYLDTTAYTDGVHTIFWTARDSGGNSDGIGSRYFSINNTPRVDTSSNSKQQFRKAIAKPTISSTEEMNKIPMDFSSPIRVKLGFDDNSLLRTAPMRDNISHIQIQEMQRVEIHLSDHMTPGERFEGYLVIGTQIRPLPVGSTLNPETGVFSWIPGPGHLKNFPMIFVKIGPKGEKVKKNICLEITPKRHTK